MNTNFINTTILSAAFITLFVLAEIMYHLFKIKVELTRKFVHVGTGLLTLLFPLLLTNHWLVLLLCSSFAILLSISLKFNFLKSINAIDRDSVGSLAYPCAVYICYLIYNHFDFQYLYFYLPILILTFCDPIAALTGKRWPLGKFKVGKDTKTLMGSGMFFISALFISAMLSILLETSITMPVLLLRIVLISIISTATEAFSRRGFDNITIPISVLMGLLITEY